MGANPSRRRSARGTSPVAGPCTAMATCPGLGGACPTGLLPDRTGHRDAELPSRLGQRLQEMRVHEATGLVIEDAVGAVIARVVGGLPEIAGSVGRRRL